MGKVFFFSIPLFGHVNYGLKLAKRMIDNGHDVSYFSGTVFKDFIQNKGVRFIQYPEIIEEQFRMKNTSYDKEYMCSVRAEKQNKLDEWYKYCYHLAFIYDVMSNQFTLDSNIPDLIVYDSAAIWGFGIAKKYDIPCVASCTPYTLPHNVIIEDPSVFARFILNNDVNNKEANRIINLMNHFLSAAFDPKVEISVYDPISPRADNKIIYTIKEFQMFSDMFEENTLFAGILIDKDDFDSEQNALIDQSNINIYISFGTIYNNSEVFLEIANQLRGLNYHFILNIGERNKTREFEGLPENWTIVNRVNQISLLPRVDLFISHGGINSVREAMHFGVPTIIIPSEGDTFFSAEDVLRNGVGDIVSINELSRLEQCVKSIIENSNVKNSCSCISSKMKSAPGIEGAVMYLEKIMNKENI